MTPMEEPRYEQEVDLFKVGKLFFEKWMIFVLAVVIGAGLGFVKYKKTDKEYRVQGTFLIQIDDKGGGSNSLLGYAKSLGVNVPSNFDSYAMAILESKRIKSEVATRVDAKFKTAIEEKMVAQKWDPEMSRANRLIRLLKLKANLTISKNKNDVFTISYYYPDRYIAQEVVLSYLEAMTALNESLELSAKKDIIIVLDSPELPLKGEIYRPNRNNSVMFGGAIAFLLAMGGLLIRYRDRIYVTKLQR